MSATVETSATAPLDLFLRAAARHGAARTKFLLVVDIAKQTLGLYADEDGEYALRQKFLCSTSKFGVGEQENSNKTPRGLHRIAQKIGDGALIGTIFRGRVAVGMADENQRPPVITTRILWLEGLEPDINRGGSVDSHRRYIYIHGTSDESTLGQPDSHGCIHLAAADLVPLYDQLPIGTLVWIAEN